MTALLHAEARTLTATRSWLLLAFAPILYPLLTTAFLAVYTDGPPADVRPETIVRGVADVAAVALLILGILAVAGEYRHGTIVSTLLVAPRRARFVAAKLVSQASLAVAVALTASAVALVAGGLYLATGGDAPTMVSGDVLLTVAGVIGVAVFYSVAGTALGAIVRNQTVAITGALLWLLAVEQGVPIVLRRPELRQWLPGGAATRLLHLVDPGPEATNAWGAALLLVVIAAAFVVAALATTTRSDIDSNA